MSLATIKKELRKAEDKEKAEILQRFFKTGEGEYAEGDKFLGIKVPTTRAIAKKYLDLTFAELHELLHSPIHEERLACLLILVNRYSKADEKEKKEIFNFYIKNTHFINNWDLVDLSADRIVGAYLLDKDKSILSEFCNSTNLWERRISIMATFHFIKNNRFDTTLKISRKLLNDKHDLIHKAVGWMLRETGKRDLKTEEKFLKKYYKKMPRTMLRYAIEKFPEKKRQAYLKGKV